LIYITPALVEENTLKREKHAKSCLAQLANGTKRKVKYFLYDCDLSIDGQNTKSNINVLPLGSYDIIIKMDWLEKHKVILNCYKFFWVYKDENNKVKTVQGIKKPVSFRKISTI
jgi:hypothetical protein